MKRRRKRNSGFRKAAKAGAKSRGQEDVRRAKRVSETETRVAVAATALVNPFDHMNIDKKKEVALSLCKRRLQVIILTFCLICLNMDGHIL